MGSHHNQSPFRLCVHKLLMILATYQVCYHGYIILDRLKRFELLLSVWKTEVLPLNTTDGYYSKWHAMICSHDLGASKRVHPSLRLNLLQDACDQEPFVIPIQSPILMDTTHGLNAIVILEHPTRIELVSLPWQGNMIATIPRTLNTVLKLG